MKLTESKVKVFGHDVTNPNVKLVGRKVKGNPASLLFSTTIAGTVIALNFSNSKFYL